MKKTAIEKAIDAIEQDIAVLVAARDRLLAQQDKQPKRKKKTATDTRGTRREGAPAESDRTC